MAKLSEVLRLCGELADGSEGSGRFRRLLLDRRFVSLPDLERWAEEALSEHPSGWDRALQDIVVAVGRWLGFEVEWGGYSKGLDGVWRSDVGSVALEVKSEATFLKADDIKPIVERAKEEKGAEKALAVVGRGPTGGPEAVIKAENLPCRIVNVSDLFKIAKLSSAHDELGAAWFLRLLDLSDPNLGKAAELLGQIPVPEPPKAPQADALDLMAVFISPRVLPGRARPEKRPPSRPSKPGVLWPFIKAGLLEPGQELRAQYKGQEFSATVDGEGWIEYEGKRYRTVAAAGEAAFGTWFNSWRFWRFQDADGEWKPIGELHKRLREQRK